MSYKAFENVNRTVVKNDIDSQGGQKPYDHVKMLKAVILKEWHSLSDKEMEEALKVI